MRPYPTRPGQPCEGARPRDEARRRPLGAAKVEGIRRQTPGEASRSPKSLFLRRCDPSGERKVPAELVGVEQGKAAMMGTTRTLAVAGLVLAGFAGQASAQHRFTSDVPHPPMRAGVAAPQFWDPDLGKWWSCGTER